MSALLAVFRVVCAGMPRQLFHGKSGVQYARVYAALLIII